MNNATKQTAPSHIAAAVEPLRAAAVARAVTRAREIAEHVLARYAARPESFEVPVLTFTNKTEVTIARRNQATLHAVTIAGEAPPAVRLPWERKIAAPRCLRPSPGALRGRARAL
jgi:hypothetical protein